MEHDVDYHHRHHQQQQEEEEEAMELPPGFRFHPTDEELITHYLARKAADPRFAPRAVGEADLNKCEPWDLPCKLYPSCRPSLHRNMHMSAGVLPNLI
jgi:hypothetical protein